MTSSFSVGRGPGPGLETRTCDGGSFVLSTLQMFLHQFGRHTDDMLPFPVLDHVEGLQRADDVTLGDAGHLTVDTETALNTGLDRTGLVFCAFDPHPEFVTT